MIMRPLGFVLAVALGVVPAALAGHPIVSSVMRANLDADAALEEAIAEYGPTDVAHTSYIAGVAIRDTCGRRARVHALAVVNVPARASARVAQADGRGRREVLGEIDVSAGGGEAAVARLVDRPGRCPTARKLFAYSSAAPPLPPPAGFPITSIDIDVVELARAYSGRELRLVERYQIRGMLSSRVRETLYRYVPRLDRYARYRTRLYAIP
jgi:hypothetical protein